MLFFLILFSVFTFNMPTTQSDDVCDCNAISELKTAVQNTMWKQTLESSKLAELERWVKSNKKSTGTVNIDFVERLENMEKKIIDIDEKLETLIEKEDTGDRENIDVIIRRTMKSEKLERFEFVKEVKSQMTDIIETLNDFKIEVNETFEKVIANISLPEEGLIEMKKERFVDDITENITLEMIKTFEHLTDFNKSLHEARRDIKATERITINEKVDGKWSDWGKWSDCSVSCGSGLRYRDRSCSSPAPSELGKQCGGNSRQIEVCVIEKCPDQLVAFHAYGIEAGATRPTFPKTFTNIGDDYDSTTGIFTCEVPGIYEFAVMLTSKAQKDAYIRCFMKINDNKVLDIYASLRDKVSAEIFPLYASGIYHLSKGDTVYIDDFDEYVNFFNDESTNFMGFLIAADD